MRSVFALLLVLSSTVTFAAGETAAREKKNLAVLPFASINAASGFSGIVRNDIEMKLFDSDLFQIIDLTHINKVLGGTSVDAGAGDSAAKAAGAGKSLNAHYVITGSVHKIKEYRIIVKLVSVENARIVSAYEMEFDRELDVYKATEKISLNIREDIEKYIRTGFVRKRFYDFKNLYLGASVLYARPAGTLGTMVDPAFIFTGHALADNIVFDNHRAGIEVGYVQFTGTINSSDYIRYTYLCFRSGYLFGREKSWFVEPYLFAGPNYVVINHGAGEGFDRPENSQTTVIEPLTGIGLGCAFFPSYQVSLGADTRYMMLLEKDGSLQSLAFGLSASVLF